MKFLFSNKLIIYINIVIIIFSSISCRNTSSNKVIRTAVIEMKKYDVDSKTDGQVKWISFDEGDSISLGDFICQISKTNIIYKNEELNDKIILKSKNDSIKIIDNNGKVIDIKQKINVSDFATINFNKLSKDIIISSHSGIVFNKYVNVSEKVYTGTILLTIIDTNDIWANMTIIEKEINNIKLGMLLSGKIHSLDVVENFRIVQISKNKELEKWRNTGDNATFDESFYNIKLVPEKRIIPNLRPGMLISFELLI